MQQPDGFMIDGQERVCKLLKSLYGLKQAPKQWHDKFNTTLTSVGFVLMRLTNVYTIAMVGAKELYFACMLMTY